MTDNHSNCESYEPLISAMIDGELETVERNDLNSHLQNCATCKQRVIAFEQVDAAIATLSHDSGFAETPACATPYATAKPPFDMRPPKSAAPRKKQRLIWRLVPIAAAATLLIGLAIATWSNPQPASAEPISSSQFVEPMKELHLLNRGKQRFQGVMLQTLDLDLRTLKLELNLLETDPAARESFAEQIDAMIEKVKLLEEGNEI